ncbi:type II secretion system protein GspC [Pseudoalteromonas tunicata]|jgi:general secretion pathway protein C|uniref:Putative general secretion pathway protein C n=1 Tax=Pseudoalteromonas tunicata D2 TaxID=87626 RepID=Q8RTI4_9GAMM|nr:type II secretion system protein GspC [Pseudoalteromonas tunicata]AAL76241.1 WmpC [Pseudoalteromonas tunicata]ATC96078.1 general secretion pathway protein C [Pseudoalteromonas tunicata]AXT31606.1 type II secretion system protein GspC [Pseudoalteromonas tunicata]EAR26817.1 putative general secretion pathway protein C [Pseudoalteromonas tunicata D2]MDP4982655.1 type II secretion system protein GspC [Pseudoalteromonas tunicata]
MQVKLEQLQKLIAKLPEKKISYGLFILILVYLAFLAAQMVWLLMPVPKSDAVTFPLNSVRSQTSHGFNSRTLTDLNMFGSVSLAPKTAPVEAPKVINSAPETRLSITLTGVVAINGDETAGSAIIESQNSQETYQAEDVIKGTRAQLKQIFSDRVILQVNGGFETLMLDGFEFSKTFSAASPTNDDNRGRLVANDHHAVLKPTDDPEVQSDLTETRDEILQEPGKLFEYIQVSPERQDGELVGYRLRPGKDPELFNRMGLQNNDLAISINGYPLNDMKQAMSAINELRTATSANITIERDGEQIDVQFSLE